MPKKGPRFTLLLAHDRMLGVLLRSVMHGTEATASSRLFAVFEAYGPDPRLLPGRPLDILVNQAAQTIRGSATLERLERERDRLLGRQLAPPREAIAGLLATSQGSSSIASMASGSTATLATAGIAS